MKTQLHFTRDSVAEEANLSVTLSPPQNNIVTVCIFPLIRNKIIPQKQVPLFVNILHKTFVIP